MNKDDNREKRQKQSTILITDYRSKERKTAQYWEDR